MWTALRALEERSSLCDRLAERFSKRQNDHSGERFREQAAEARCRAAILRQVLGSQPTERVEPSSDAG